MHICSVLDYRAKGFSPTYNEWDMYVEGHVVCLTIELKFSLHMSRETCDLDSFKVLSF